MKLLKSIRIFLFFTALAFLLTIASRNIALAKVSGVKCNKCHTMHASQNGVDGTPTAALLQNGGPTNSACVACHTNGTGGGDGVDDITKAPLIDTVGMLAGGYYSDGEDAIQHNVVGFKGQDLALANDPPGLKAGDFGIGDADRLTCAGTTGCHGNRGISGDIAAVHKAHHTDDREIDGNSVGTSYRFLYLRGSGVVGVEDPNGPNKWEWQKNVYSAGTPTSVSTISKLCADCHGDFHGGNADDTGTQSPWLRHPTEVNVSKVHTDPLSITNVAVGFDDDPTAPKVICQSCHYSHGSGELDILRFNYDEMLADGGSTEGCLDCHERQRQSP